jgi:predicted transcriptional regulator
MRKIDKIELRRLVEAELWTQDKIAEHFGCHRTSVQRMCKRMGLVTQRSGPRSGEDHPDWKGGRVKVGGYWYIYRPEHPLCTKQRRVAEHRLVMEQMLGRYLAQSEVVHHKDGNKENNHPDNLEVFGCNGDHLRHELTGRVPDWTDQGKAKLREAAEQRRIHPLSKSDDQGRTRKKYY